MFSSWLSWIRTLLLSIPVVLLVTILASSAALLAFAAGRRGRFLERCKRQWARWVVAACFVRVQVSGLEKLDRSHTYLVCANHLSFLDPPVLLASLPFPVRFLAKRSLFSIPFLGWGMRAVGEVPVDRKNPRAAARSLARVAELLRQETSIVIFPEGGRSLDGLLQPFHCGAFRLAIQAQVPVVPVAIQGTRAALPPGSIHIRGGRVRIRIGHPISTSGLNARDRNQLASQVEQRVREMLETARTHPQ
ncbi:MAG: 1-acyl-sn-glycerol-3-phosphate acyltransferase [Acidobacteria bacterium]|nr:1-acyl-sn-glycerol-3-phosphate acyltransferase [Acidobacteriota bacterium]